MARPLKSRLGRGLGAIISGGGKPAAQSEPTAPQEEERSAPAREPVTATPAEVDATREIGNGLAGYREIAVADVVPNPYQPRTEFRPEYIQELAESIRAEGLLQPIVVRAVDGKFQLIAGERRWRAFQELRLKMIPARVMEAGNASAATMALIENLQREGLNPVEEAHGYASLIRDFDLTQEQVAQRVAKGRATVANSLRLLLLDGEVQGFLSSGLLSTGHAKALLGIEDRREQVALARRIVADGLSVRAAEALVAGGRPAKAGPSSASGSGGRKTPVAEAAAIADIEKRLGSHLNTRVKLRHARRKGAIVIDYAGNDDLQRILEKIGLRD